MRILVGSIVAGALLLSQAGCKLRSEGGEVKETEIAPPDLEGLSKHVDHYAVEIIRIDQRKRRHSLVKDKAGIWDFASHYKINLDARYSYEIKVNFGVGKNLEKKVFSNEVDAEGKKSSGTTISREELMLAKDVIRKEIISYPVSTEHKKLAPIKTILRFAVNTGEVLNCRSDSEREYVIHFADSTLTISDRAPTLSLMPYKISSGKFNIPAGRISYQLGHEDESLGVDGFISFSKEHEASCYRSMLYSIRMEGFQELAGMGCCHLED